MEKPAVQFSEQGFKMFLGFIDKVYTGRENDPKGLNLSFSVDPTQLPLVDDSGVLDGQMSLEDEEFFKGYESFKKGEPNTDPDEQETKKKITRKRQSGIRTPRKTFEENRDEYNKLSVFLVSNGPTKLDAIWEYMHEIGVWEFEVKQASSRIKVLNKYFGGIERVDVGIYQIR